MPVPTTTYARGEICEGCHERRLLTFKVPREHWPGQREVELMVSAYRSGVSQRTFART